MAQIYTAKAAVEVEGLKIYEDSSGAPCVVRVADFAYAMDFLGGEVKLNCIKHGSGRRASEVAAERARRTYAALIEAQTTPEWREANVKLYSDA